MPYNPDPTAIGALENSDTWGFWCFDPGVFIDDDGKAYMYFGGAHPDSSRLICLKNNLIEVNGKAIHFDTPGFFEASAMHKYNGKYYWSYSGFYYNNPSNIEYIMSNHPMSGYSRPMVAMYHPPVNDGFNTHHCIFQYNNEWYMAYHTRHLAYENNAPERASREFMRSVALDRLYYNEDGTIQPVEATRDGLPQLKFVNAFAVNEAETMAAGYDIKGEDIAGRGQGRSISPEKDGAYLKVRGVDFGDIGAKKFSAKVSCTNPIGGSIEVRIESPEGLLLGTLPLKPTENRNQWQVFSTEVQSLSGVFDIYFVMRGNQLGTLKWDSWYFEK